MYLKLLRRRGLRPFILASVASSVALIGATFGAASWASADEGGTAPGTIPTLPEAPRYIVAAPGDASAFIAWTEADGEGITGYVVTSSPGSLKAEFADDVRAGIVTGLTNDTTYTFTVAARNVAGIGPESKSSNPVTPREGLDVDEERLERLHEHLRRMAAKARARFERAKDHWDDHLDDAKDRVQDRFDRAEDRAKNHLDRESDRAQDHLDRAEDRAKDFLERHEDSPNYDEMKARIESQLEDARERVKGRLDDIEDKLDSRLGDLESRLDDRLAEIQRKYDERIEQIEQRMRRWFEKIQEILAGRLAAKGSGA